MKRLSDRMLMVRLIVGPPRTWVSLRAEEWAIIIETELHPSNLAADHFLHDLGSPAVNPLDAGVAPQAGDGVFVHIARPAMQLQRSVDHLPLHLGVPQLGRRRFACGALARQMPLDRPVQVRPAHLQLGLKIGERELGVLELENGLAESLAILGEFDRLIKRALSAALRAHSDRQAFLGQLFHQVDNAAVLAAQNVRFGHAHIGKEQLGRIGGMLADLVEIAALFKARSVRIDQHQRGALGARRRIGFGNDDHNVGGLAIGDVGL